VEIETALIAAPIRTDISIFGRPLLERVLINCQAVGIRRFVLEVPTTQRKDVIRALGDFGDDGTVTIIESFSDLLSGPVSPDPDSPGLLISGNLVFSKFQLNMILNAYRAGATPIRIESADPERSGPIAAGTFAELLLGGINPSTGQASRRIAGALPFAVDGRPDDSARAEYELARSIREETKEKDAPLARWIDRRLSWRLSYRLARTRVRPNQVTIANTLLGLLSASLFAVANYWVQLGAALLFLLVITLDGVDGELARLKMRETEFGANLDVITDTIVNLAVLVGIIVGCYRVSGDRVYLELLPVLAGGFALCAVASYWALKYPRHQSPGLAWLTDRLTSRDFAYLLVLFALFDRLRIVAWGTAFGSFLVGFILLWAALRMHRDGSAQRGRAAAQ